MAVEEVLIPPRKRFLDPKGQKEKDLDSAEYWRKEAEAARSKREYLEETKMADRIREPEPPPEPPFKISGSVNLGNIDVTEQQRLGQEQAEKARQESQTKITQLETERNQAIQALHSAELQALSQQLTAKIETLQQAIATGNKRSILEELTEVEALASKLGFAKPEPISSPSDLTLKIELVKMEQQLKRDDRDFQRQMKKDEREWQIELRKLDQQTREAEAKLQSEKDRYAMFAQAPERIGAVIAKGIMQQEPGMSSVATTPAKRGRVPHHVECGFGESGELDCPTPGCGSIVGVGPTARSATCVKCGSRFSVTRIGDASKEPAKTTAEEE